MATSARLPAWCSIPPSGPSSTSWRRSARRRPRQLTVTEARDGYRLLMAVDAAPGARGRRRRHDVPRAARTDRRAGLPAGRRRTAPPRAGVVPRRRLRDRRPRHRRRRRAPPREPGRRHAVSRSTTGGRRSTRGRARSTTLGRRWPGWPSTPRPRGRPATARGRPATAPAATSPPSLCIRVGRDGGPPWPTSCWCTRGSTSRCRTRRSRRTPTATCSTRPTLEWFRQHYLQGADPADPSVSPLLAPDLPGVAPATIISAGFDPLRDENLAYADRLSPRASRSSIGATTR